MKKSVVSVDDVGIAGEGMYYFILFFIYYYTISINEPPILF